MEVEPELEVPTDDEGVGQGSMELGEGEGAGTTQPGSQATPRHSLTLTTAYPNHS